MFGRMKQDRETPESTPRPSDALDSITSVTIVAPADARAYVGELLSVPNGRRGWIDANDVVFIEGKDGQRTLLPNAAADQSPTGFSWGYAGSGPSALARSILTHRLGETNGTTDLSWLMLDDFRSDIMRLPHRLSLIALFGSQALLVMPMSHCCELATREIAAIRDRPTY